MADLHLFFECFEKVFQIFFQKGTQIDLKMFPPNIRSRSRQNVRQNLLLTVNVYLQCCIIIKDVKKHFFSGENIFSSMSKWRLLIDHLSLGNVVITMAMVIPIITKAMFITIMTKVMMFIIIMTKASVITKY